MRHRRLPGRCRSLGRLALIAARRSIASAVVSKNYLEHEIPEQFGAIIGEMTATQCDWQEWAIASVHQCLKSGQLLPFMA